MKEINEVRVPDNVMLSNTQKFVLSKLMLPEGTPLTAYEKISKDKNVVANRDILVKLGMVQLGQNEAQITDKGKDAMRQENLIDEMDNLTPFGEQFAYAEDLQAVEQIAKQNMKDANTPSDDTFKPEPSNAQQPTEIAGEQEPGTPSIESWDMILNAQTKLYERMFMNKQKK